MPRSGHPRNRGRCMLPADLDPRGYLANASWLQNTVQPSQLVRLNCSLTSLQEAMAIFTIQSTEQN